MCITFTSCLWWWLAECWMDFAIAMIREYERTHRTGHHTYSTYSYTETAMGKKLYAHQILEVANRKCTWDRHKLADFLYFALVFDLVSLEKYQFHLMWCSTMCCRRPIETFPSALCAAFVRRIPPCLLFEDNSLQNRIVIDRSALYMPELLNCIELHPRPRSAVDNR